MEKEDKKVTTLAEQVREVENEIIIAMFEVATPILKKHGYSGFKDIRLVIGEPDENGNVKQSLVVIL